MGNVNSINIKGNEYFRIGSEEEYSDLLLDEWFDFDFFDAGYAGPGIYIMYYDASNADPELIKATDDEIQEAKDYFYDCVEFLDDEETSLF